MEGTILGAILALTFAVSVRDDPAGEFYLATIDQRQMAVVDRNSIRWADNAPTVSMILVTAIPRPVSIRGQSIYIQRQVDQFRWNCETGAYEHLGGVFQDAQGEVISSYAARADASGIAIEGTSAGVMERIVCDQDTAGLTHATYLSSLIDQFFESAAAGDLEPG